MIEAGFLREARAALDFTVEKQMEFMKRTGQSVTLTWGEDDGEAWECSWITGGIRFTAMGKASRDATTKAIDNCIKGLIDVEA